jgi:hypothetical protein
LEITEDDDWDNEQNNQNSGDRQQPQRAITVARNSLK